MELTIVASRNTAPGLAVGSGAGVLLLVGVGDTAVTAWDGPVLVLTGYDGRVLGQGRREGHEAEDDGGEGELHFGWSALVMYLE